MAGKQLLYAERGPSCFERGVNKPADAVKITLGPKAGMWFWKEIWLSTITNDGVTIAKEIELEDPLKMGAQLAKEWPPRPMTLPETTPPPFGQAMVVKG